MKTTKTDLKASWDSLAEYMRIRLMGMIKTRDRFTIREAAWIMQTESRVCLGALQWLLLEKKIDGKIVFSHWFKPRRLERKFLDELDAEYRKWKDNSREKGP